MPEIDIQQNDPQDEILIMDESGQFKILAAGQLKDYREPVKPSQKSNLPMDTGMEEKMLQPPLPAIKKNTASFYFHPEDEEEVAKHKVQGQTDSQKRYSLDKILIKVAENYKLELADQLKSRLRLAIYNFLRDRRTLVDTQEVLKRSENEAGINLPEPVADNLLEFLKEIKRKINQEGGLVVDEKVEAGEAKVKYLPPREPVKQPAASQPIKAESTKPIPLKSEAENLKLKEDLEKQTAEVKKELKDGPIKTLPRIQRPLKSTARRVADVKKDYKLVGPVDELAGLSLETFRRLGENTKQRSFKVLSKINLLTEDSLAKRTAGIKAWQKSPLYKMYVAVGQSSMDYGVDVEQVIKQYGAQGRQIITLEEFEAISDINRQLRF
ncbi:MAG TPA: hypothetical protein VJK25_00170 [Patescibacteria group bacterium]|nr:hypothetical protein [Patescibacteria group bacterium]